MEVTGTSVAVDEMREAVGLCNPAEGRTHPIVTNRSFLKTTQLNLDSTDFGREERMKRFLFWLPVE